MEVTYQSVLCRLLILASARSQLVSTCMLNMGEFKEILLNVVMESTVLLLPIGMVSGSNK